MRRIITAAALLATIWVGGTAQASTVDSLRINVRVGIGGSPTVTMNRYENTSVYGSHERMYNYNGSLAGIYGDYNGPISTIGALFAEGQAEINETINAGLVLGFSHFSNDCYNGITGKKSSHEKGTALLAMPKMQVNFVHRNRLRLYSSLAAGILQYCGYEGLSWSWTSNGVTHYEKQGPVFAIQYSPIGIELNIGSKFFLFGEIGAGTMYVGGSAGVGYSF